MLQSDMGHKGGACPTFLTLSIPKGLRVLEWGGRLVGGRLRSAVFKRGSPEGALRVSVSSLSSLLCRRIAMALCEALGNTKRLVF